ncbi:MAG: preprotein translocase subunit SecE [bacterium]|jgi:preprotein translocase subunit SecE
MFKRISQFFSDVQVEFKKVTWPSREETIKQTGVVVVMTLLMSVFLGGVDLGLSEVIKLVIK